MNLVTGAVTATIPVPAAHYLVLSPDGSRLLVFSDNSNNVTVIATGLIGTNNDPRQPVGEFVVLIVRCGAFSPTAPPPTFSIAERNAREALLRGSLRSMWAVLRPVRPSRLSGATYGLLSGGTLYVAGTPPHTACGAGTAATTCGTLNIVDVNSMKVTNPSPIIITDGYHNRMAMGSTRAACSSGRAVAPALTSSGVRCAAACRFTTPAPRRWWCRRKSEMPPASRPSPAATWSMFAKEECSRSSIPLPIKLLVQVPTPQGSPPTSSDITSTSRLWIRRRRPARWIVRLSAPGPKDERVQTS